MNIFPTYCEKVITQEVLPILVLLLRPFPTKKGPNERPFLHQIKLEVGLAEDPLLKLLMPLHLSLKPSTSFSLFHSSI
jgi:hypothetical protein